MSFEYVLEKGAVLRHVDLSVPAGTTVAIVGRSGSGKIDAGVAAAALL